MRPSRMLELPKGMYGDQAWYEHVIHIDRGMVTDRLSKSGNKSVPFKVWLKNWDPETLVLKKVK